MAGSGCYGWVMVRVHYGAKNLYFFGGSARRQKCDIHPADAIIGAEHVGRGLTKGGGLVGVDESLFPCGGDTTCHNDGNCIIVAWEKCLWGSIFGGKTNVECGFGDVVARTSHANMPLRC